MRYLPLEYPECRRLGRDLTVAVPGNDGDPRPSQKTGELPRRYRPGDPGHDRLTR
jgi:hypothetical protein